MSSTRVTAPSRTTATRCGADQPIARPAATSSSDRPADTPTAAAASALWTDSRPRAGIVDRASRAVRPQDEAHPVEPERLDRLGADVGVGGEPVADRPRRRPGAHPSDDRIVRVQDGHAVGRERLEQLALGLLDRLERADARQVDGLDRGHHADPRPRDPGEVGDLAADVHPHLEDGRLVLRPQAQDRQRQPDLVVLVALVAQRPEAPAEDGRDGLLGRGLGDAPGDADHERVEPAAPAGREGAQRRERVGDPDRA